MSLNDFKKNLVKIKGFSGDYNRLMKEKQKIELDIKNLKAKYRENKVQREVFGEYNKNLDSVSLELSKIREKILKICSKNSEIITDELKDVF